MSAQTLSSKRSDEPPGPKPLPLLGSLPELRRNPMEFYARLARDYGGFSRFYYGRKPTFLAASPEAIKELLVDKREIYVKNTRYAAIRRAIGIGLLNSEGETWKKQRRHTQNVLNRKAIRDQTAQAAQAIDPELDRATRPEAAATSWQPAGVAAQPHGVLRALGARLRRILPFLLRSKADLSGCLTRCDQGVTGRQT